ncbi:MAG: PIN domain nuclease [Actinomycetota bacterium]|jgi:hypothetical protein|nr:PIN domain nuclease [Actinomycetota bacterium]
MPGVTLDTGALIALERADPRMRAVLDEAHTAGLCIDIPAGALAQAWRACPRQGCLARVLHLANVTVPPPDALSAKASGILCGPRGTRGPIDASVVLNARRRDHTVITSDPADLRLLDAHVRIVQI